MYRAPPPTCPRISAMSRSRRPYGGSARGMRHHTSHIIPNPSARRRSSGITMPRAGGAAAPRGAAALGRAPAAHLRSGPAHLSGLRRRDADPRAVEQPVRPPSSANGRGVTVPSPCAQRKNSRSRTASVAAPIIASQGGASLQPVHSWAAGCRRTLQLVVAILVRTISMGRTIPPSARRARRQTQSSKSHLRDG